MAREIRIGERLIGDGYPTYIVAEIGINHNGDLEIAKELIDVAKKAGVDAVKFEKLNPEVCFAPAQKEKMRETPWGYITYLEYRHKLEFGEEEYQEIDSYCKEKNITWFASVWDQESLEFMEAFDPICFKIPAASLTDTTLLDSLKKTGRPLILSTGMSTMEQIRAAVDQLGIDNLILLHATSVIPCDPSELNLRMLQTLRDKFSCPIGYSGHEVGLVPTAIAVAQGACLVERQITVDRALWGSDQAASVEPGGLQKLVKYIRVTEDALGDGVKRVYDSELPSLSKFRKDQWEGNF